MGSSGISRLQDQRVMPAHPEMLECIVSRDAKRARQAMRAHLLAALEVQKKTILPRPQTSAIEQEKSADESVDEKSGSGTHNDRQ